MKSVHKGQGHLCFLFSTEMGEEIERGNEVKLPFAKGQAICFGCEGGISGFRSADLCGERNVEIPIRMTYELEGRVNVGGRP